MSEKGRRRCLTRLRYMRHMIHVAGRASEHEMTLPDAPQIHATPASDTHLPEAPKIHCYIHTPTADT